MHAPCISLGLLAALHCFHLLGGVPANISTHLLERFLFKAFPQLHFQTPHLIILDLLLGHKGGPAESDEMQRTLMVVSLNL